MVTYVSSSGNTRKVAEAIFQALPGDKDMKMLGEVKDADGYDLVFVGFPVVAEGMPGKAKRFMNRQLKDRKVALFMTHGMPGDMPEFDPVLPNCRKAAEGSELIGVYDCQGKMVDWMPKALRLHPRRSVRRWAKMGGERHGHGHPDAADLYGAGRFATEMLAKAQ